MAADQPEGRGHGAGRLGPEQEGPDDDDHRRHGAEDAIPEFRAISEKFRNDHEAFKDAFARAWFKLTHRDMGPKVRYLGPEVPAEDLIWQDPIPAGTTPSDADVAAVKAKIADSGLTVSQLVKTAWASACDLSQVGPSRRRQRRARRGSRRRRTGRSTSRQMLAKVLGTLDGLRGILSLADAIVLGGVVGARKGDQAPANVAVPSPAAAATRPRSRPTPTASR